MLPVQNKVGGRIQNGVVLKTEDLHFPKGAFLSRLPPSIRIVTEVDQIYEVAQ